MHVSHVLSYAATIDAMKTNSDWVLANHNVTGYYRVHYDKANWERLLLTLSTNHTVRRGRRTCSWGFSDRHAGLCADCSVAVVLQSIPVINRAQLLDDAFNLAR